MTPVEPRSVLRAPVGSRLAIILLGLVLAGTGCAAPTSTADSAGKQSPAPQTTAAAPAGPNGAGEGGASYEVTAKPGAEARSQRTLTRPRSVRLSSGMTVPVRVASTSRSGLLQVPPDIRAAGWWDGGARLGDTFGAIVVAGHVDSATQGLGPFAQLLRTRRGDRVVLGGGGLGQTFVVDTVDLVSKASLDTREQTFAATGPLRLVLITCAGPFLPDRGGYQNLAVVTARPA